jgi:hypothetical protein
MFKSVKYDGFETAPELRAKCEAALPILLDEIRTWTERVEVIWELRSGGPYLLLALDLGKTGGRSGTAFPGGLPDALMLREKIRANWSRLLDLVLEQQSRLMKAELESAGAA